MPKEECKNKFFNIFRIKKSDIETIGQLKYYMGQGIQEWTK